MVNYDFLEQNARRIRATIAQVLHKTNSSHIGGALSVTDIVNALYFGDVINIDPKNPSDTQRDKVIMSKGHCSIALYTALGAKGYFPLEKLADYCQDGSNLKGHADLYSMPGIETTTGSLGHGLPIGTVMALANKMDGNPGRIYVIMSDGECQEGSVWEAAITASRMKLDNLITIIDANGLQAFERCENMFPNDNVKKMWKDSGWALREIDGHDYRQIIPALYNLPIEKNKPSLIFANTIKGKGVSFMEDRLEWHYKSPNAEQLKQILEELKCEPLL